MFKKLNKDFIYIFILVLISILVYRRWTSFDVFYAGDWPFFYKTILKYFLTPSVWFNLNNLGSVYLTTWRLPIDTLQGVFSIWGYSSNYSEKIIIFWPTIIIANIGVYALARRIIKSDVASFISSLVFNYNTYYFVINTAFLLYAAAAWSVITLYFTIVFLDTNKKYFLPASIITLFISSSYDLRIGYITIFLLFFLYFYYTFILEKPKLKLIIKRFSIYFCQVFFLFLLNVYWVIPFFKAQSLTTNAVLQRDLFGNEFSNILYSITLFHPFWTGYHTAYFDPQPIIIYFWLIPLFAFWGLWLNKKNKLVVFFGILAILGIFLTKQVSHPFPSFYQFLFTHVPGFNAFREASKFYFVIVLGYSILIGSFVSFVNVNLEKYKHLRYFKYSIIFIIAFIFLWNTRPIITGEIEDIYTPKKVPNDYLILRNFMTKDSGYYKTFWVPNGSNWSVSSSNTPIISSAYILSYDWSTLGQQYAIDSNTTGKYIISFLKGNIAENILNESSVKYVIVPVLDKENDDNVFLPYAEQKTFYVKNLDNSNYLHKLNINTKDLVIYENYRYRPHIYITPKQETINKEQSYKSVYYKFITPSQYIIEVNNVKEPFYLNFSDAFNNGWKIRVGGFNWLNVLIDKNYFISENNHFQNDAKLNSFWVDPQKICSNENCKVNKDGSYDIKMTLYFAPQSYMYFGLIISGFTLIVVLFYCFFELVRNHYYDRKN